MNGFVLKGDFVWCRDKDTLICMENAFAVCSNGICQGVFNEIPCQFADLEVLDYSGRLIFPGMSDLHIHAPQFEFRGNGMDLELMDWLNTYTFPTESRYNDVSYARRAYTLFADALRKSATTRAVVFATNAIESNRVLMQLMDNTGLVSCIGRTLADRNAPEVLFTDKDRIEQETLSDIEFAKTLRHTMPVLTPRFYPACSDGLLKVVAEIQRKTGLPLQTHLSENPHEIEFVHELCPDSRFYADAYERCGVCGGNGKTIMAHCVYSCEEEIALLRKNGVFIAHCPQSNLNVSSGIAPAQKYLQMGMNIGLATDVAGGHSESMFRAVTDAIQVSKMYWRYIDDSCPQLTFPQALYMATLGGGAFFGKVGSFDAGYEFDAVVINDSDIPYLNEISLEKRAERAVYMEMDRTSIAAKFCQGRRILL